jgi:hypothetical protein
MKECPFRYSLCGEQAGIKCPDNVWCNKSSCASKITEVQPSNVQQPHAVLSEENNKDMLQLLCDLWAEVQSSSSLRLSLPVPLAERIHAVVVQQQHT